MLKIPSFLIYMAILILIYLPILLSPVNVDPDAQLIFPLIDKVEGLSHYFELLFSYKTLDIQPVRDFSLWIDWTIFKNFQVNTIILHNIFLWSIILATIQRLTKFIFPDLKERATQGIVILYGIYPLFAATLCWGVARKHILAYLFILLTTEAFLKRKNFALITLLYALSVFSQPITIPWPIWASLYLVLNREKISEQMKLIPSYLVMMSAVAINFQYYKSSALFKSYYESKTENPLEVADKFLGLGHYVYQLILPYWPAFAYNLGDPSVWAGILIFTFIVLFLLKSKIDRSWLMIWGSFFFFPLAVVLTNPQVLSDNYLLTSSFAIFIILIQVFKSKLRYGAWIFAGLFIFWGAKTSYESYLWTDPMLFLKERNFDRRANCDSAINLARKSYLFEKKLSTELSDFLTTRDCHDPLFKTPAHAISYIHFQSYVLFYEKNFDLQKRMDTLSKLAQGTYFPKVVLASLYAEIDRKEEVLKLTSEIHQEKDFIQWLDYYEPIVAEVLKPYCEKNHLEKCLEVSNHFTVKKKMPWY